MMRGPDHSVFRRIILAGLVCAPGILVALRAVAASPRLGSDHAPRTESPNVNVEAPDAAPPLVSNPHWDAARCDTCHASGPGPVVAPPRETIDALCVRCHDGQLAKAEDHPVGRSFARADVRLPRDWPAPGGMLGCLTCHDVLAGCRLERKQENPLFLRGAIPGRHPDYCAQCHTPDTHARLNPHVMLDNSGNPRMDACNHCHTHPIPPTAARAGDAALRAAENDLCLSCHSMHWDFFEPGHLGAKITPEILQRLLAADAAAGLTSGGSPQLLPLGPKGTMGCSTCHNPHQRGLFPTGSAAASGGMQPQVVDNDPALRVQGGALCQTCHGP